MPPFRSLFSPFIRSTTSASAFGPIFRPPLFSGQGGGQNETASAGFERLNGRPHSRLHTLLMTLAIYEIDLVIRTPETHKNLRHCTSPHPYPKSHENNNCSLLIISRKSFVGTSTSAETPQNFMHDVVEENCNGICKTYDFPFNENY